MPNQPTARNRRQLAKLAARIERWWQAMPEPERLPYYPIEAIASATRASAPQLGEPLRALGWARVQVRLAGPPVVVWVAPGARSPLRPRGRPPTCPIYP
jgi:hypothetical protein